MSEYSGASLIWTEYYSVRRPYFRGMQEWYLGLEKVSCLYRDVPSV